MDAERLWNRTFQSRRFLRHIIHVPDDYQLVTLANGERTLFSARYGEKMHPGPGPRAEADLLCVRQLRICERLAEASDEFVIWDVGLGAAANAIAVLRATTHISGRLRIVSFDNTAEPLEFALKNADALGYLSGYEKQSGELLRAKRTAFDNGSLQVDWEFHLEDFPAWLSQGRRTVPPAHAIFYDAFSPAKNPVMWTLPVFQNLYRALDPGRPCALTTYSRSTLLRATLLMAGFFVGIGHATGLKEETTIAANALALVREPLDHQWLTRAQRSHSAEPLHQPIYSRAPLTPASAAALLAHPQFKK
ncbi:MAG TPA: MnmC family methyltransferase [Verrucomicrobiae bacterium]|nr:MnmC family methyltransferase [Verrucomicrobiae bacterium]